MVEQRPEERLPPIDLKATEVKELRPMGSFDSELDLMLQRMEKVKPFPEKELIIEAMGTTRLQCPFNCETWAVNMGYHQVFQLDGHFTRIFLTHTQVKDANGKPAFTWEHFNKMAAKGIIVYNTHRVKGLNSTMFPFKRLVKKYNTEYFSNTIAYMVALAVDEGYKKIHLYGCDMMTREEYAWEKGGIEYWLGRANGMGVETTIAEGSSLLKTITGKPYGAKYFNLKDLDPDGSLRRQMRKYVPKSTSTSYLYENPIRPPDPTMTPWVKVR